MNISVEPISPVDLMMKFEGLGENVEFGFAQRACGAEPLGLLRFISTSIADLTAALDEHFAGVLTEGDLDIGIEPGTDQYVCCSRRYPNSFKYQTKVSTASTSEAAIRRRESKRLEYLKARLLEDLRSGRKIWVRKGSDGIPAIRALHRTLQSYGSNSLLIVSVADVDHPAGTVEWIDEGIIRGYIHNFKICLKSEPMDLAGWVSVCRNAYIMINSTAEFEQPKLLKSGDVWTSKHTSAFVPEVSVPAPGGSSSWCVKHLQNTTYDAVASFEFELDGTIPSATILVSARIWIPENALGNYIDLRIPSLPILHCHPADFSRRNCWQEVWITLKRPRESRLLSIAVCSLSPAGASFNLSDWKVRTGILPDDKINFRQSNVIWHRPKRGLLFFRSLVARRLRAFLYNIEAKKNLRARTRSGVKTSIKDELLLKAEAMIAGGSFIYADDLLSLAMDAFPNDPNFVKAYAFSAHNHGRYADGVARWGRASALLPEDPMCVAGLAANLREHISIPAANDVINRALEQFPVNYIVLSEAARVAEASNRHADALWLRNKLIALYGAGHPAPRETPCAGSADDPLKTNERHTSSLGLKKLMCRRHDEAPS